MNNEKIDRLQIIKALTALGSSCPAISAVWEGGSVAFDRADAWSDIDVQFLVEDGHVESVASQVENTLSRLSPLRDRYAVPDPTWHGHAQRFFRLRDTSEYMIIDCVFITRSRGPSFLEPERHGVAKVLVDKHGIIRPQPLDRQSLSSQRAARLAAVTASFTMFQTLISKEILRGRPVDAMAFYMSQTIRPLVELLGIKYRPDRFDFGLRYTKEDLPPPVHDRLQNLLYVSDIEDLERKRKDAADLFAETLAGL